MRFSKEPRDLDKVDADLKQFMSMTDPDVDVAVAIDDGCAADGEVAADRLSRVFRDILNEYPLRRLVLGDAPGGRAEPLEDVVGGTRWRRSCLRIPTSSSSTW